MASSILLQLNQVPSEGICKWWFEGEEAHLFKQRAHCVGSLGRSEDSKDSDQDSTDDETKSDKEENSDNEEEEEEDVSQEDSESESDEDECAADGQTGKAVSSITIGLGCEKGKHRSVAVVERLLRDESLRAVSIRGRGRPVVVVVEVSARHRDINRTGKDARRCGGNGRQRAEARHRKKRGGHMNDDDEEEWW